MRLSALAVVCITVIGSLSPRPASADLSAPRVVATFGEMPKVVTLPDGRLLAFFHPLTGEMTAVETRTSSDGGKAWGAMETLLKLPEDAGGFGYSLPFIDRQGELHIFFFCDVNSGVVRPNPRARPMRHGLGQLDIWHARTTGGRKQWGPARRIWEGRAGDMQSVIQLRSGRIVLPISYWVDRNWGHRGEGFDAFTFMGSFRCSSLYSDDGGATWQQSPAELKTPTSSLGELGAVEPVIIQLTDGRVWMLIRTQMGRFYESFSKNGVDWTSARPTALHSSDSPAGLVRLLDGRLLMFINDCRRFPYAVGGRQALHAAVSSDEGGSWQGWREVLRDPYRNEPPPPGGDHGVSYVYPTLLADGKVLFTMWVATGKQRSIYVFDPKWLDQTTATCAFDPPSGERHSGSGDDGLAEWSVFGTKGAGLSSHPSKAGKSVLSLRKAQADWPAGTAVWNFPAGGAGRLSLRLMLRPGFRGGAIALTDHFSTPFDGEAAYHNLYNLPITPSSKIGQTTLRPNRWHDVTLDWDVKKQTCRISVDGRAAGTFHQRRNAAYVNYLRLSSTAIATNDAGFIVESVHAEVQPPH